MICLDFLEFLLEDPVCWKIWRVCLCWVHRLGQSLRSGKPLNSPLQTCTSEFYDRQSWRIQICYSCYAANWNFPHISYDYCKLCSA
jgi:hypothetical protein